MTVTLFDCSKERLAHLQWCARSFAKSMRIIYNYDKCVSYVIDVNEQNMIQKLDNEELLNNEKVSYKRKVRWYEKLKFWEK